MSRMQQGQFEADLDRFEFRVFLLLYWFLIKVKEASLPL